MLTFFKVTVFTEKKALNMLSNYGQCKTVAVLVEDRQYGVWNEPCSHSDSCRRVTPEETD